MEIKEVTTYIEFKDDTYISIVFVLDLKKGIPEINLELLFIHVLKELKQSEILDKLQIIERIKIEHGKFLIDVTSSFFNILNIADLEIYLDASIEDVNANIRTQKNKSFNKFLQMRKNELSYLSNLIKNNQSKERIN